MGCNIRRAGVSPECLRTPTSAPRDIPEIDGKLYNLRRELINFVCNARMRQTGRHRFVSGSFRTVNPLTRQAPLRLAILRLTLAAACMAALAACSSGEGGPAFGSSSQTDPGTVDFAIAYVKRTLPTPPDTLQDDARELRTFNVDADVFVRDCASPTAPERSVTQRITGNTQE